MSTVAAFPSAEVFIETGLSQGVTVLSLVSDGHPYTAIHSIELHPALVARGRAVFAGCPEVTIHEGSSPVLLPTLCDPAKTTVFWLDAHYSPNEGLRDVAYLDGYGQCPLLAELAAITAVPWAVAPEIFIDDVVLFQRRDYAGTYADGCDPAQFPTEAEIRAALPGYVLDIGLETGAPRYYHAHVV